MYYLAALALLLTLIFLPIRIRFKGFADFFKLKAQIRLYFLFIRLFTFNISINTKGLSLNGKKVKLNPKKKGSFSIINIIKLDSASFKITTGLFRGLFILCVKSIEGITEIVYQILQKNKKINISFGYELSCDFNVNCHGIISFTIAHIILEAVKGVKESVGKRWTARTKFN